MSDWFIIGFGLIMAIWNGYLMRQNQILVNKIMSKNYGDYAVAEKHMDLKPNDTVEEDVSIDPYDTQKARELNGILGMG